MKRWIARHPLSSYFIATYVLSWSVAVPLALQAQGILPPRLPWSLHYLTAFGPAVAALLVWLMRRDSAASVERASSPSIARSTCWWMVGFGSPLILFVIARVGAAIAGRTPPAWTSLGHVNFLPDLGVMAWGLWFFTSGLGEELGWRGFALPQLQRTHSALTSSLLLSIGWAGWHVPAFFYVPSYAALGLRVVPGFFIGVLAGAIVLTWLYNSSGRSVLAAVLWHASFNFVTAAPDAGGFAAAVVSTLVIGWAIAIVWRYDGATLATRRHAGFKTPDGEAEYRAAYDAVMQWWPVPYESIEIPSRFGTTHAIVCGPKSAPPLVLLHGYMATSTMWAPNAADFSRSHRVYAIDVMGQPSKSVPADPIRSAADFVAWLTATLDTLHLDRVLLLGMSFGGWLALAYTAAAPERVEKLALLSPGGFLPISWSFRLRGMLMMFVASRGAVYAFMRWAGFSDAPGDMDARPVLDLMHLGLKHFRPPKETLRVAANPLTDDQLQAIHVPVLLLIGDREVLCDAAAALARARQRLPDFQGDLVPGCSHDMCFSQCRIVDARVLDFLDDGRRTIAQRGVA